MEKIRIVIADDHPAFLEGLRRILEGESWLEVVGQAANGEEAVNFSKELLPDVIILDVSMPKLNGIEATKQIKESSPDTEILILSAFANDNYVYSSLKAGAIAYLTKNTPLTELLSVIRMANNGNRILGNGIGNIIINQLISNNNRSGATLELHTREIEIIKLVARGQRNKEIASVLNISQRTVQAHLSNIYNKLDVCSRTEAVLKALKDGWVDTDDLTNT